MKSSSIAVAAALLVLVAGGLAAAGPQDSRPGEVRVVFSKKGTVVRAEANALAAPVATLASGTKVTLQEVKLPWIRVSAVAVAGQAPVSGWMRAFEAVEPAQLAATPPPAASVDAAQASVASRDVSAAGRQLTPATERDYRKGRQDLERGYALVDQMERDSAAIDPTESIDFIMEGDLGRRGRDYLPPPRVPAGDAMNDGRKGANPGDVAEKVGGLLGRLGVGGKRSDDLEKVGKVVGALAGYAKQLNEKFSPAQEYYIGRAVAANAFAKYGVDANQARRRYVSRIGDAMIRVTERLPGTYGGYHFDVLDCEEVNGVSGPGGFVLLTRGAVEACATEDELAGLIAHELAHVSLKHGEKVVRQSSAFKARLQAATQILGAVADVGDARVGAQLLEVFQAAVGEMVGTAVSHGYGRQLEFESDAEGSAILYDVLYDWASLRNFMTRLATRPDQHVGATHAAPADRATYIDSVIASYGPYSPRAGTAETRLARFQTALSRAGTDTRPR